VTLTPSAASVLAAEVRSERGGVQALFETLAEQRQLLTSGDADRLTDTVARKRELLLQLAQLGEQRNRLLRKAGVSPDGRGMRAILDHPAATDELRTEWRLLIEITQKAQRLNEENGVFIEAGMRANQQALSVLISAASGNTYGPGGRTVSPLSSRTLASA
jgi:flagellar biosynthesis/type III secretory pathway chaperone